MTLLKGLLVIASVNLILANGAAIGAPAPQTHESKKEIKPTDSTTSIQILLENTTKESKTKLDTVEGKLGSKRHVKPSKTIDNFIDRARALEMPKEDITVTVTSSTSTKSSINEIETTTETETATDLSRDEFSNIASEMDAIMESVPNISELNIPFLKFQKDPEEESINERITQVARQLAEGATRTKYEQGKLGYKLPFPAPEYNEDELSIKDSNEPLLFEKSKEAEKVKPPESIKKMGDSYKIAKSFIPSNALPLVSHLPQETTQLQLISEIPSIPQFFAREGFPPITPAPEMTGPILGGPPLTS